MSDRNYWDRLRRQRMSRRSILRSAGKAGVGAAGIALVGCGGDDDDDDQAVAQVTPAEPQAQQQQAAQQAEQTVQEEQAAEQPAPEEQAEPEVVGAIDYPTPPKYSDLDAQRLLTTFHWAQIGPQTRVLGTPRRGGVFSMPAAGFGLASLHPTEEVVGQWPFSYTHNNILGMSFRIEDDPDRVSATSDRGLAESVETIDAATLVANLKPGIVWQDIPPANGEPLTVEDIRATYELLQTSPFHAINFADLVSIEDSGGGSVTFKSSAPAVQLLGQLRNPSFAVINKKQIDEGTESLQNKAIGTGAYEQANFEPEVVRAFRKSNNSWDTEGGQQLPFLDGVALTIIRDPVAAVAAFRDRQIDYYRPVSVEEFTRLESEEDIWAQAGVGCGCRSPRMAYSLRDPLFQDQRVRQAFSMAVDRQTIIDVIFGGAATARSWLPWFMRELPWPETFEEMGPNFAFDPSAARQLLEAAVPGGISTTLKFSGEVNPSTGRAAGGDPFVEVVQQNLEDVGVTVGLEGRDFITHNFVNWTTEQWDGLYRFDNLGLSIGLDVDLFINGILPGAPRNGAGIDDQVIADMSKAQRAETDPEARLQIHRDIDTYVNKDQMLGGIQLPEAFAFSVWHKYMHNVIDSTSWWISGGAGQQHSTMWMDETGPSDRDIESF
ncbi:MAG: ABC transporter substrate-binding protein [Dehalococcoidia bacterium]